MYCTCVIGIVRHKPCNDCDLSVYDRDKIASEFMLFDCWRRFWLVLRDKCGKQVHSRIVLDRHEKDVCTRR